MGHGRCIHRVEAREAAHLVLVGSLGGLGLRAVRVVGRDVDVGVVDRHGPDDVNSGATQSAI